MEVCGTTGVTGLVVLGRPGKKNDILERSDTAERRVLGACDV